MLNWLKELFRQPPKNVAEAKRKVDYENHYMYYLSDTAVIKGPDGSKAVVVLRKNKPKGSPSNHLNCVGYALAYRKELGRGTLFNKATLKSGEMHCVLRVDGWELDNFAPAPRWVGK